MSKHFSSQLAIMDWGIGGIGLYSLVKQAYPRVAIRYFSDAGFTPYGKLPKAELRQRVTQVARFLRRNGATHLAIACNAASTALPLRGDNLPLMTGVIEHGIRAVAKLRAGSRVGVVGGKRTIRAGEYRRGLPRYRVQQRIAQPISAFIEAGELDSHALHESLDRIVAPLAQVNALVLACTHYPAISSLFAARAPNARIIDPAEHMLAWMQKQWNLAAMARGDDVFFTTGKTRAMKSAAQKAFGVEIDKVSLVGALQKRTE